MSWHWAVCPTPHTGHELPEVGGPRETGHSSRDSGWGQPRAQVRGKGVGHEECPPQEPRGTAALALGPAPTPSPGALVWQTPGVQGVEKHPLSLQMGAKGPQGTQPDRSPGSAPGLALHHPTPPGPHQASCQGQGHTGPPSPPLPPPPACCSEARLCGRGAFPVWA